jgi:anhydro-N-acetylmuramic acid kinase
MNDGDLWTAVGLMSGTSMDGIDAALVRTDGREHLEPLAFVSVPYTPAFRERLQGILGGVGDVIGVERALTILHGEAVRSLLRGAGLEPGQVDVVGFHGHTILHQPDLGRTWQIGDGPALASETGIDVVYDLRSADMDAGGQGAPLAPIIHRVMTAGEVRPTAVLNIGGVANVTWIGVDEEDMLAFDTGPGNALIDDWMARMTGAAMDVGGEAAARGRVYPVRLARLMSHPYFNRVPPKSLDRNDFDRLAEDALVGLSSDDGAALLTAFTVESVARGARHFREPPERWIVCGGGRRNATLMQGLADTLDAPVGPVDDLGWDGDAIEAQAFALLAVRSRMGLPYSYPGTTGVSAPTVGGVLAPKAG